MNNSPVYWVSATSLDEINQVFVDGSNGLVLGGAVVDDQNQQVAAEEDPLEALTMSRTRQA